MDRPSELNLLAAVLHQAVMDYLTFRVKGIDGLNGRSAESWIFDDRSEVFNSFSNICSLLDISPSKVREKLTFDPVGVYESMAQKRNKKTFQTGMMDA